MFLTPDNLAELTGARRKARQIAALNDMGIRFVCAIDGRPKVLQAEVHRVMLGGQKNKQADTGPRFDQIHG